MSKMNQVIQVGEIEGNIHYYIEDYAYTYLKKQKGKEKTKYFLYGEKEEQNQQEKLYIYGISEKPKMEQTYFKEYYPLGFLKLRDEEKIWVSLKGQEEKITGFYVFYAPNQAMQEYLVDHREDIKEEVEKNKTKRLPVQDVIQVKEVVFPLGKKKIGKKRTRIEQENRILSIGGFAIAIALMIALTSANGQKKIEIFKQLIAETVSGTIAASSDETIIIEEKSMSQISDEPKEETQTLGVITETQETNTDYENPNLLIIEDNKQKEEEVQNLLEAEKSKEETEQDFLEKKENKDEKPQDLSEEEKNVEEKKKETAQGTLVAEKNKEEKGEINYEEYIVKKGDTLEGICKNKYGSLSYKNKICEINNIENADHISPGQKLYLP